MSDGPPFSCAALGRLASYGALSRRLDVALDLCEEATLLADEAGSLVFRAYSDALAARIRAVLEPGDAAPALIVAIQPARKSGWWLNVWPVASGAGRWSKRSGSFRRLGAAMSADEVVDFVLGELVSAQPATTRPAR